MATSTKPAAKKAAAPAKAPAKKAAAPAKAAAKNPVAAKAPAAAPVAAKKAAAPAPRAAAPRKKAAVAPDQRSHYIEVAAYYIAERHGFQPGRELEDWAAAEAEIDRLLTAGLLNP